MTRASMDGPHPDDCPCPWCTTGRPTLTEVQVQSLLKVQGNLRWMDLLEPMDIGDAQAWVAERPEHRRIKPASHEHEKWQIRDDGDGPYCAACGERIGVQPPSPADEALFGLLRIEADAARATERKRVTDALTALADEILAAANKHGQSGNYTARTIGLIRADAIREAIVAIHEGAAT